MRLPWSLRDEIEREERQLKPSYTALMQQSDSSWIGWVEEIPGVNSQGKTREELLENLRSAQKEALEMNCEAAVAAANGSYEVVSIEV